MICRPLPSKVSDWIAPRERLPRSGGWHVSTVVVAMLKAMGTGKYDTWGQRTEPRKPTDEVGYMWEDVLSDKLAERVLVPDGLMKLPAAELQVGQIYGTPDRPLYDIDRGRFIVEEVKATYMSCGAVSTVNAEAQIVPNESILTERKFSYWRLQSMTYAAMIAQQAPLTWYAEIERRDVPAAIYGITDPPLIRLRALFLNGRYKGELAVPLAWELEPTHEELAAWWGNVVAFAAAHPELKTEEEPV